MVKSKNQVISTEPPKGTKWPNTTDWNNFVALKHHYLWTVGRLSLSNFAIMKITGLSVSLGKYFIFPLPRSLISSAVISCSARTLQSVSAYSSANAVSLGRLYHSFVKMSERNVLLRPSSALNHMSLMAGTCSIISAPIFD